MKTFYKVFVPFFKRNKNSIVAGCIVASTALYIAGQMHQREKMDALDGHPITMGTTK